MVNIRDVAKRAGVSAITVSRVINNSGAVNSATRERVNQAIEELGYVPNTLAKSFRSKQTSLIALVLSDITNPFWTTIARGVEDTAEKNGFHVILCNTDENPEKEANYINVLLQRRVDGIIIASTINDKNRFLMLKRHALPCVLLDRRVDGFKCDTVVSDGREGARKMTEHLIRRGYHRIAIVAGPPTISTAQERVEGYCQALRENQVPIDEGLIVRGSYRQDNGYESVKQLLKSDPRPQAIFAGNNFIAVGALHAIRELGLRIPEDVALAGFDDIPQGTLISPALTVVSQRAYEMGVAAAQSLITRLSGKYRGKAREIVLATDIIIRESCGQVRERP
ncbi:MAG: LacI family DNA-binding transcriptional regulator [Chloroflexi bacterium]|nr:LacI family DNA-binding transcriptional regulator [Chloroflexota bacterium]